MPSRRSLAFLVAYVAVWSASLGLLAIREHFELTEPLFMLIVVGGGFSFVAWLVTRRIEPAAVDAPGAMPVLAYLLVVAAIVTWVFELMPSAQPLGDITKTAVKLVVFVAIPALLFRTRFEWRWTPRHTAALVSMGTLLTLFQAAFGSGFRWMAESGVAPSRLLLIAPIALVWLSIEAGVVEEYFFRGVVQTRLERALATPAGGIVVTAFLFGLIHAPGLYLRTAGTNEALGAHPSLLLAIGYAIVILSPTGLFFGVLWSRTRSLPLVIALHGLSDLVPDLLPFARHFHLT